jgi:hypothetical protein
LTRALKLLIFSNSPSAAQAMLQEVMQLRLQLGTAMQTLLAA